MKKYILLATSILSVLLITSCTSKDSEYTKNIIGKYYSIDITQDIGIDEDIPVSMTLEYEEEFLENGKSIDNGTLKFLIYNSEGSNIIVKYIIEPDTSAWEIKNGMLIYHYEKVDFPLVFDNTNASTYTDMQTVKYFREFVENDFSDAMKQTLLELGDEPSKIVELNEKRLITEDRDGEQTIQKRIK